MYENTGAARVVSLDPANDAPSHAPAQGEPAPDAAVSRAEIDAMVASAHAYPRSLRDFMRDATDIVTLDAGVAEKMVFAQAKDNGETHEGPSIRFAEAVFSMYGNCRMIAPSFMMRAGTITATASFHDLQKNAVTPDTQTRAAVHFDGSPMDGATIQREGRGLAAIAKRNAILAGIPRALWWPAFEAARTLARGDATTLEARRRVLLAWFAERGVPLGQVCATLKVNAATDIDIDKLLVLAGFRNSIEEMGVSADFIFSTRGRRMAAHVPPRAGEDRTEAAHPPAPEDVDQTADLAPDDVAHTQVEDPRAAGDLLPREGEKESTLDADSPPNPTPTSPCEGEGLAVGDALPPPTDSAPAYLADLLDTIAAILADCRSVEGVDDVAAMFADQVARDAVDADRVHVDALYAARRAEIAHAANPTATPSADTEDSAP
jgi:hypothetical protein